jgi:hypothetical protein
LLPIRIGAAALKRPYAGQAAIMITDSFDSRTLANMELALERACKVLSIGAERHSIRRHIASRILECAAKGNKTLGVLTEAGHIAATELCSTHGVR